MPLRLSLPSSSPDSCSGHRSSTAVDPSNGWETGSCSSSRTRDRGVVAALDMVDGISEAGLPPAHVGLHAGPVLFQDGDYFGQTVNVASRIAEYARPGEVLVSQEVLAASEGAVASFTEIGPVELKGVSGTVRLHDAHRLN